MVGWENELAPSKLVETDTVRQQGTPYGASPHTIPVVVGSPGKAYEVKQC